MRATKLAGVRRQKMMSLGVYKVIVWTLAVLASLAVLAVDVIICVWLFERLPYFWAYLLLFLIVDLTALGLVWGLGELTVDLIERRSWN